MYKLIRKNFLIFAINLEIKKFGLKIKTKIMKLKILLLKIGNGVKLIK